MTELGRSSYYYKPQPADPAKVQEELDIVKRMERIKTEFVRYGRPRMTKALHREGLVINSKCVRRIMAENSLLCKVKRRFVKTTYSNHKFPVYINLIKDFPITGLNRVWIADITYIRLYQEFCYLACILDAYSRKVIGYAISTRIDTELVLAALRMAISNRRPPKYTIHHSDQGVQYASGDYVKELTENDFRISMSRKGNVYDNATMESFYKTLKYEEVYLWDYHTIEDAYERVSYFIDEVYNHKRLHSSLGYVPPNEFEEAINTGQTEVACV